MPQLPLLVLFGSQTGAAKSIAETLHTDACTRGFQSVLVPLNEYSEVKFQQAPVVVIITSTTGNGDPPNNAEDFWRFIRKRTHAKDLLAGMKFAILGLGDTNYDKFCACAKTVHKRLVELGAHELYKFSCADEAAGLESTVDPWVHDLWPALDAACGRSSSAQDVQIKGSLDGHGGVASGNVATVKDVGVADLLASAAPAAAAGTVTATFTVAAEPSPAQAASAAAAAAAPSLPASDKMSLMRHLQSQRIQLEHAQHPERTQSAAVDPLTARIDHLPHTTATTTSTAAVVAAAAAFEADRAASSTGRVALNSQQLDRDHDYAAAMEQNGGGTSTSSSSSAADISLSEHIRAHASPASIAAVNAANSAAALGVDVDADAFLERVALAAASASQRRLESNERRRRLSSFGHASDGASSAASSRKPSIVAISEDAEESSTPQPPPASAVMAGGDGAGSSSAPQSRPVGAVDEGARSAGIADASILRIRASDSNSTSPPFAEVKAAAALLTLGVRSLRQLYPSIKFQRSATSQAIGSCSSSDNSGTSSMVVADVPASLTATDAFLPVSYEEIIVPPHDAEVAPGSVAARHLVKLPVCTWDVAVIDAAAAADVPEAAAFEVAAGVPCAMALRAQSTGVPCAMALRAQSTGVPCAMALRAQSTGDAGALSAPITRSTSLSSSSSSSVAVVQTATPSATLLGRSLDAPINARVLRARYLTTDAQRSLRRVIHVDLDVSGTPLQGSWSPGDVIAAIVPNPPDMVEALCARLAMSPDVRLDIQPIVIPRAPQPQSSQPQLSSPSVGDAGAAASAAVSSSNVAGTASSSTNAGLASPTLPSASVAAATTASSLGSSPAVPTPVAPPTPSFLPLWMRRELLGWPDCGGGGQSSSHAEPSNVSTQGALGTAAAGKAVGVLEAAVTPAIAATTAAAAPLLPSSPSPVASNNAAREATGLPNVRSAFGLASLPSHPAGEVSGGSGSGTVSVSTPSCAATAAAEATTSTTTTAITPRLPTLREVLSWAVDLTSPPRKTTVRLLAEHASDPFERDALMFIISRGASKTVWRALVEDQHLNVLDLLGMFPSAQPPLASLLAALSPPVPPRFYSIASSPLRDRCIMSFAFGALMSVVRAWTTIEEGGRSGSSNSSSNDNGGNCAVGDAAVVAQVDAVMTDADAMMHEGGGGGGATPSSSSSFASPVEHATFALRQASSRGFDLSPFLPSAASATTSTNAPTTTTTSERALLPFPQGTPLAPPFIIRSGVATSWIETTCMPALANPAPPFLRAAACSPSGLSASSSPKASASHASTVDVSERAAAAAAVANASTGAAQGPTLRFYLRPASKEFTLPASPERPLIMIGPGTGIAPFIGFLQHRAGILARAEAAEVAVCTGFWRPGCRLSTLKQDPEHCALGVTRSTLGPAHLFFGSRHARTEFLFEAELRSHLACGSLTQLHTAFSRDGAPGTPRQYVQHRLKDAGLMLAELIIRREAQVYVCGDGVRMAKDVHAALVELLAENGRSLPGQGPHVGSAVEAEMLLAAMAKGGRYCRDVWLP